MPDSKIAAFPVQLEIRLVLDSVSYSNALPPWVDPLTINYVGREHVIRTMLTAYLAGASPQTAFEITVPKKSGNPTTWITPSINDQIVIQGCVSSIAEVIEQRCIDQKVVFSCLLNTNPTRLAFLDDQVAAWNKFQITTEERCANDNCLLQIDLKNAYQNITLDSFKAFLGRITDDHVGTKILNNLLVAFSDKKPGLPLISDSIFFLGNAYLSEVDKILKLYGCEFIRFVDDYKIFASSVTKLESLLPSLRGDLRKIGFEIGEQKLKLGTGEQYLEAASRLKYAVIPKTEYIDAAVQPDVFAPEDMLTQVIASLKDPDEFLHQGFGRLQMAFLRRMRVRGEFSQEQGYETSPAEEFAEFLSESEEALLLIKKRLKDYSNSENDAWRLVWVLYLCKSLQKTATTNGKLHSDIIDTIDQISQSQTVNPVGRLWASKAKSDRRPLEIGELVEKIHALGYLEAGRAWHEV
jgi:Reverse transcriptase (RNA-dependent DNA polymerase)